jgi:ankyrin repeat protein
MQRNLEAVKQHIAAGADVNAKDVNGYTPLDWAIFNKDTETAALLRKHGGKTSGELSIHKAAEAGNIEAVKQHLAAGADVNAKDDDGKTPLDHAEFSSDDFAYSRDIEVAKKETANLLRKHGGKTGEELKAEGK